LESRKFSRAARNRFLRFLLVGSFNTAFGYGIYLVLLVLTLPYWAAWGISLALSLVVGFILSGALVFGHISAGRFVWYLIGWGAIYVLNVIAMQPLVTAGFDPRLAPFIVLPINVVLSFFIQKILVFRPREMAAPVPKSIEPDQTRCAR
jgi:putative flippase GtrA